jgi:hypothetical protein
MDWLTFIGRVHYELVNGNLFNDFRVPIYKEQNLTEVAGIGLRKLYGEKFNLPFDLDKLADFVSFRQGPTDKDRKAYKNAKKDRWVFFHDVFNAPDIIIKDLNNYNNILPVEVKFIKGGKQSPSQSIATAIGQALIYTTKFPISLLLIGVLRSAQWGRYQFRTRPNDKENLF